MLERGGSRGRDGAVQPEVQRVCICSCDRCCWILRINSTRVRSVRTGTGTGTGTRGVFSVRGNRPRRFAYARTWLRCRPYALLRRRYRIVNIAQCHHGSRKRYPNECFFTTRNRAKQREEWNGEQYEQNNVIGNDRGALL